MSGLRKFGRDLQRGYGMCGCSEDRWEYGSDFHLLAAQRLCAAAIVPPNSVLFATGRDALRSLIEFGRRERGWRRWFMPTYFCPDVRSAVNMAGVKLVSYPDLPLWETPGALPEQPVQGDVVCVLNYFGLRGIAAASALDIGDADLVEDHTHDPWSAWAKQSKAAYCLASLRKSLPVPDGAVVWSPRGYDLPVQPRTAGSREVSSWMKLAAMTLKRFYLTGHDVDKEVFRQLQVHAEVAISTIVEDPSGISPKAQQMLSFFPWDIWRDQRRVNYHRIRERLRNQRHFDVLTAYGTDNVCPFAAVLYCHSREARDLLRESLLAAAIYPAILWPIEANSSTEMRHASQLSQRILCLPCDFRYDKQDVCRVVSVVESAFTPT